MFRPIFEKFLGVGCQSPGDVNRLVQLGFPESSVRVTGNLKFDAAKPDARSGPDVAGLLRQIGVNEEARLLVAGSTHAGEEAVLAEMLPRLREPSPMPMENAPPTITITSSTAAPTTSGCRKSNCFTRPVLRPTNITFIAVSLGGNETGVDYAKLSS